MGQFSASTFCCGTGDFLVLCSCVQPGPSPGRLCWGWQLWPFLLARERILNVLPAGPCMETGSAQAGGSGEKGCSVDKVIGVCSLRETCQNLSLVTAGII